MVLIFIPIPRSKTYVTTMTGRMPKGVRCEECDFEYVYLVEETVQSRPVTVGNNEDAAEAQSAREAESLLSGTLRGASGIVPCPACGHVQTHMVPLARRNYRRWIIHFGVSLVVSGVVTTLFALLRGRSDLAAEIWFVAFGLIAAGVGLVVWRYIRASSYDPNDTPVTDRIEQGQSLAVSLDDYLVMNGLTRDGLAPTPMKNADSSTYIKITDDR